jgi:hypothetical protein
MKSELKERRKQARVTYDSPDFISVQFNIGKGPENEQTWELGVLDCSKYGLKLLVTDIDEDLLKMLKPGDVIKDISLYAESSLIRIDATIRHISKIGNGRYEGQHCIGIESSDIIKSCVPNDWKPRES